MSSPRQANILPTLCVACCELVLAKRAGVDCYLLHVTLNVSTDRMITETAAENIAILTAEVQSLPPVNREVMVKLLHFVQKVGAPANHEHTKMNLSNLALVWSPNIFRCPHDNPMTQMKNTKLETKAMLTLLREFTDIE